MAEDPRKQWTAPARHPFVAKVQAALLGSDITAAVFKQWQTDVISSFTRRNAYGLSIDKIPAGPIDSRTLIEMHHRTLNLVESHGVALNKMADQIATLTAKIDNAGGTLQRVDHKTDDVIARFRNLNLGREEQNRLEEEEEEQQQGRHDEDEDDEAILLSSYSELMRTGEMMSVKEIAFNWFRYDARRLFDRERGTLPTMIERNRLKSHFCGIKTAMHVVIKNLTSYPGTMPTDPNMIVAWETSLKSEVAGALEKIKPRVKSLSKKTVRALGREFNDADFPEGTPEEVKNFFSGQGNNNSGRRKRSADESVAAESNSNRRQRLL
jgi:hypothetical protein